MKDHHTALINILTYTGDNLDQLKAFVREIKVKLSLRKISSIYLVEQSREEPLTVHDIRSVENYAGLCVSILGETKLSSLELVNFLREVEKKESKRESKEVTIRLLAYENITKMTPELTLPHPDLHAHPELLIPSAEVWGSYLHPVLKRNLSDITSELSNEYWGSFFAQGSQLQLK